MRRSKFSNSSRGARAAGALFVLATLFGSLLPATQARQDVGRPRRVGVQTRNAAAPAQAKATPQPRQTPTPKPTAPVGPTIVTQDAPPPPAPPKLRTQPTAEPDAPQQDESGQEVNPDEVVTIDTSLVNLHVRVIDRNNKPINDVTKSDFRVFENGAPQEIVFADREEVPITYG